MILFYFNIVFTFQSTILPLEFVPILKIIIYTDTYNLFLTYHFCFFKIKSLFVI